MHNQFDSNLSAMKDSYLSDLSKLLSESVYSDAEIGEMVNITRGMVYRWRTGKVKKVRNSNLFAVAKALGYSIDWDSSDSIFIKGDLDAPIPIEDKDLEDEPFMNESNNTTRNLIDTLTSTNKLLLEQIKNKDQALKSKDIKIKDLESMMVSKPNMNLDNSRMQFIVNMETQEYVSCTQLYADLFDKNAFDIIKNAQWSHLVHPDDVWRFPIIATQTPLEQEKRNTWKLQASKLNPDKDDKESYVETITLPLDKEGILKKVDAKLSTEEAWEKSNKWYRAFENKVLN
tara:strand:+ start:9116 stop:9976 length:861 start_codon:yes stop_codon:yes gene_type:complete